ncbi:MAG: N-acetylmuramoyl-L-alanine amidase [Caldilineaceae bacterium]|nr:N-acetylmuramoyl-L-alanine amidase [Caldilineaceae bacterium]
MAQTRFDAEMIFGVQEAGGELYMLEAGRPGWILFSEAIGHDPNDRSGKDYSAFSEQGLTVIVRLNHGYYPHGTLPVTSEYGNFARRCANFVAASRGCHLWIIGNEMNYAVERPGVRGLVRPVDEGDPFLRGLAQRHNALYPDLADINHEETSLFVDAGEPITPDRYARCYRLCRNAIHLAPDHTEDRVLIGAVCPWNTHTVYPGNPHGDWIKYFQDILMLIGPNECDGITLHAYTHGADPALILDDSPVDAFPQHASHFQVYRDFMYAIPSNLRHMPIYITEANQSQPWEDSNTGWIQEAYAEIHRWNIEPGNQKIRALILHRWPMIDYWHIEGKPGVIRDFVQALRYPYRWQSATKTLPEERETAAQEEAPLPPGPRYRAHWMEARLPQTLYAGQTIIFPVTVHNLGALTWPQEGPQPVRLGYHFYQNQVAVALSPEEQVLSPLPHDVPPEQHVTISAQVQLPKEPGNYTMVLDLLHEGVTWFQDQQSDTLIRWMTVLPTPSQPRPVDTPSRSRVAEAERTPSWSLPTPAAPSYSEVTTSYAADDATYDPPPEPEIFQAAEGLPTGHQRYLRRSLEHLRYLVLSHTGAPPILPLPVLAQAHIDAGYPGIAYNFVIAQSGEILQVSAIEDAVTDAEWAVAGINIALEGEFNEVTPSYEQINATADLCAWLLQKFPKIGVDQIVGLGELIPTLSPGATFSEGPNWRRLLREAVQARIPRPQLPTSGNGVAVAPQLAPPSVARPPIQDITAQLPRDPLMFYSRSPEDIHLIVVNHTGVAADVPIDVITRGFRERGLPGILYQFYVAENGAIYQTQPLLQVVDGEKPYIAHAINIAFAGSFDDFPPSPAQIEAGGRLIAWLFTQYPQLSTAEVRGVSELIPHRSPGEQWLRGRRWKDLLLQEVQIAPERQPDAPQQNPSAEIEGRVRQLEYENDIFHQEVTGLRAENARLRQEIEALRAEPNRVQMLIQPTVVDVVGQLPQHPTLRYDERRRSMITHIAIHHTAVPPHVGPERIADLHISEDPSRNKRPWPGIGYHYFVRADGTILRTQPLERVAYHTAGHNEYSVGIVFAGSFMNGSVPTPEQLSAGAHLVAWLMQDLHVPLQHIWGHREFPDNRTTCPGSEWLEGRKWRDLLYDEIVRIQRGER